LVADWKRILLFTRVCSSCLQLFIPTNGLFWLLLAVSGSMHSHLEALRPHLCLMRHDLEGEWHHCDFMRGHFKAVWPDFDFKCPQFETMRPHFDSKWPQFEAVQHHLAVKCHHFKKVSGNKKVQESVRQQFLT
jgi:hypothetical protein